MNTTSTILAVLISASVLLFAYFSVAMLIEWTVSLRDWFRDQGEDLWSALTDQRERRKNGDKAYEGDDLPLWKAIQKWTFLILFVLAWAIVEIAVLAGTLLFYILVLCFLRSAANDVRDWWHRGQRN